MHIVVNEATALEREAWYLHRTFFREQLDPAVIERYVAANRLCFPDPEPRLTAMLETIVTQRLDAEAIEFALRAIWRKRALTRKIQILFYLVEVRSLYYGHFVSDKPGLWRAMAHLAGSVLRTVWKGVKGVYLVWKYDFV